MEDVRPYVVTTRIPALTHSVDMKSQNLQPGTGTPLDYTHLFRD